MASINTRTGRMRVVDPLWGTTTVGISCTDGVVLASDTRVVQGYYFIAHKRGKKILKIDDYIAATISGGVADAQALISSLQWEARSYKLERGVNMPVKAAANIASIILSSTRMAPLYIQLIIGGYDREGASLYVLDPLGGFSKEAFVGSGSGSPVALGYLEAELKPPVSVQDAIPIAVKSILAAMQRDTATGNDFEIMVVDSKGCRELSLEEKTRLTGLR
ncbi:MAG: proteasome subunit beta [Candidatus Brockarchaeota archaeon]|nr:proteasome subunit beta [Candidatus Brockarchaeota archaeon]MBO3809333.1 proteasome subunit beta [Candidatus Brockarchaeota archaeon]